MALVIYPNELFNTDTVGIRAQAFFTMLSRMVTAGWTCVRSGDGVSLFSATGSVFNNAAGMQTADAYFVMRMPGNSNRQLHFRLNANGTPLWLSYSFSAGFTGGSATTQPTATDQVAILGGAVFGGGIAIFANGANHRVSMAFDNAAPYGWWVFLHRTDRTLSETIIAMDPIATGTGPPGDLDPYVFLTAYTADAGTGHVFYNGSVANSSEQPKCSTYKANGAGDYGAACYRNKGVAGEAWVSATWQAPYAYPNKPSCNRMGTNPANGKDQLINVPYLIADPSVASGGWKGVSSLFWFLSTDRGIGDAFTIASTRDYRSLAGMACKWDGSTPLIT